MIYTPRISIDLLERVLPHNKFVCTKIDFKGYEISISMDSNHGPGDLTRSDIRIYTKPKHTASVDCTDDFLEEGECMLYGNAETLLRVMKEIERK